MFADGLGPGAVFGALSVTPLALAALVLVARVVGPRTVERPAPLAVMTVAALVALSWMAVILAANSPQV